MARNRHVQREFHVKTLQGVLVQRPFQPEVHRAGGHGGMFHLDGGTLVASGAGQAERQQGEHQIIGGFHKFIWERFWN
jgi:hypothetical protein